MQHPGSFGGLNALRKYTSLPTKTIKAWISEQDTYTLHKPIRRHFERERVLVNDIDHQWEIDLVDLSGISKVNNNHTFLLTVFDVLSKYAWVKPLKNKTPDAIYSSSSCWFRMHFYVPG